MHPCHEAILTWNKMKNSWQKKKSTLIRMICMCKHIALNKQWNSDEMKIWSENYLFVKCANYQLPKMNKRFAAFHVEPFLAVSHVCWAKNSFLTNNLAVVLDIIRYVCTYFTNDLQMNQRGNNFWMFSKCSKCSTLDMDRSRCESVNSSLSVGKVRVTFCSSVFALSTSNSFSLSCDAKQKHK